MPEPDSALCCPVCLHGSTEPVFRSHNGFPIQRCAACGVVFTDARSAPPAAQLYPAFEQTESGLQRGVRRSLAPFIGQRAALVRRMKPAGRLLDYGCGSGSFAKRMCAEGYDVVGLEPFSLGHAVQTERLLLLREPLDTAAHKLERFDVITLWHVLEHLPRPVPVLVALRELLAPDGVIIVSVPNFRSWQGRAFRGAWFHLDAPRHLLHFDAGTLASCLRRSGLEPIRSWEFMPEYGLSGWLQSALNLVLPRRNYLYELAKDRGALRALGPAEHALHTAGSAVLGAPILALSLPVEAIASTLHAGAALTVAATRSESDESTANGH